MNKKVISTLIGVACLMTLASCGNKNKADTVLIGNIYTADANNSSVEAVAMKDGKIIFAGNKADVSNYIGKKTAVKKYENGELITPALCDAHNHLNQLAIAMYGNLCSIPYTDGMTADEIINYMKKYIDDNSTLEFYKFTGWEMAPFEDTKYHCPTAAMIDDLTDMPILAVSSDGHTYWVNSKAMQLAGINKDTPTPEGGVIVRDENGEAVGCFKDAANPLIDIIKPETPLADYENGLKAADEFSKKNGTLYRFSAYDNETSNYAKAPTIRHAEELDYDGKLSLYTQGSFQIPNSADAFDLVDEAIYINEATKGGNYECTTVKIFMDGIIENKGAYLMDPYEGEPNNYGTTRWSDHESIVKLGKLIAKANNAGLSVHFHGMGDRAIKDILDAMEYAVEELNKYGLDGLTIVKNARNAIAHLALVQESDYVRFAKFNITAALNPWSNKDPKYFAENIAYLGDTRANNQYPMQSFIKAGVNCSWGTDLGASFTYDSVECFHVLTTRTYKNDDPNTLLKESEKLSRIEALNAMTKGGAYMMKKEDMFGSIEVGKDASFVVFDKDLLNIPDTDIMNTEISECMFRGEWCYSK